MATKYTGKSEVVRSWRNMLSGMIAHRNEPETPPKSEYTWRDYDESFQNEPPFGSKEWRARQAERVEIIRFVRKYVYEPFPATRLVDACEGD